MGKGNCGKGREMEIAGFKRGFQIRESNSISHFLECLDDLEDGFDRNEPLKTEEMEKIDRKRRSLSEKCRIAREM